MWQSFLDCHTALLLRLALNHQTAKINQLASKPEAMLRLALNHQTAKIIFYSLPMVAVLRLALNHQTAKIQSLFFAW